MTFCKAAVLAAVVVAGLMHVVLPTSGTARADEAIDCSSTPFAFSGQGYLVDCERHEGQARKDGGSGSSRLDIMNVTSDERSVFLTMISVRLQSTNLYMRYQGLRDNARYFFGGVDLNKWNGIGNKGGYDTAEFESEISGQPSHCVAVQRYMNPAFGGYQRHVVGVGCAAGGVDAVYTALGNLRAPGD